MLLTKVLFISYNVMGWWWGVVCGVLFVVGGCMQLFSFLH